MTLQSQVEIPFSLAEHTENAGVLHFDLAEGCQIKMPYLFGKLGRIFSFLEKSLFAGRGVSTGKKILLGDLGGLCERCPFRNWRVTLRCGSVLDRSRRRNVVRANVCLCTACHFPVSQRFREDISKLRISRRSPWILYAWGKKQIPFAYYQF